MKHILLNSKLCPQVHACPTDSENSFSHAQEVVSLYFTLPFQCPISDLLERSQWRTTVAVQPYHHVHFIAGLEMLSVTLRIAARRCFFTGPTSSALRSALRPARSRLATMTIHLRYLSSAEKIFGLTEDVVVSFRLN